MDSIDETTNAGGTTGEGTGSNAQNASSGTAASAAQAARRAYNCCPATPQEIVLAAAARSLALTKGKSQLEVETMINLFSLTTDNLRSILTQMLICKRTPDVFETNL